MPVLSYSEVRNRLRKLNDYSDYKFFANTYEGSTKKMKILHKVCGHEFYMTPKNFISGQRCPHCASIKRRQSNIKPLDKKDLRIIKEKGFEIIDFKGKSRKSIFRCKNCNNIIEVTFNNFKNIKSCPHCSIDMVTKLNPNIDKYNSNLKHLNFEIIPEYFHGTLKKSKFRCTKCGLIQNGYYYNILYESYHCPCTKSKSRYNVDYYLKKLKEMGLDDEYEMYTETFVNSNQKMKFKHLKCGTIFWKTPTDFFSNNQYCNMCVNQGSITPEMLKSYMRENNLILLDSIDSNISKKKLLNVQCNLCKSIFTTTIQYLDNEVLCKCRKTNSSKGEKRIAKFLKENQIEFEVEKKFKDLKNKESLRFDFYLSDLNIAIEYDGIHHFKPIEHFGGKIYLEETKKRDEIKNNYCRDNEITLIRIPYYNYNSIEDILSEFIL